MHIPAARICVDETVWEFRVSCKSNEKYSQSHRLLNFTIHWAIQCGLGIFEAAKIVIYFQFNSLKIERIHFMQKV